MKLNLTVNDLNKKERELLILHLHENGLDYFVVDKELVVVGNIEQLQVVLKNLSYIAGRKI